MYAECIRDSVMSINQYNGTLITDLYIHAVMVATSTLIITTAIATSQLQ